MKRKSVIGAVLVAVIALGAGVYAFAAPGAGAARTAGSPRLSMSVMVSGQKQGPFSQSKVAVIAVSHEIVSPRDQASGLPTGKRQHKPLTIRKEWDATTPKFYNALTNNENLSVLIGLLRGGK